MADRSGTVSPGVVRTRGPGCGCSPFAVGATMIVGIGKEAAGGDCVIVGLTEADIAEMRKGLTKTKQGGPQWGFRSMIVFMGQSDEENIKLLSTQQTPKRQDDLFPKTGQG
jgi:hypothetical protein